MLWVWCCGNYIYFLFVCVCVNDSNLCVKLPSFVIVQHAVFFTTWTHRQLWYRWVILRVRVCISSEWRRKLFNPRTYWHKSIRVAGGTLVVWTLSWYYRLHSLVMHLIFRLNDDKLFVFVLVFATYPLPLVMVTWDSSVKPYSCMVSCSTQGTKRMQVYLCHFVMAASASSW